MATPLETYVQGERVRLQGLLQAVSGGIPFDVGPDQIDLAADLVCAQAGHSQVVVLEHQLRMAEVELAQVREGKWGTCKDCGGPIEPERIGALMATSIFSPYCLACAKRH